jgi:two-component system NtrC family response regulator
MSGPRVLVADDDRAVRAALELNLTRAGWQVRLAASAEEALVLLQAEAPDVLLSDVRMGGASGMELLAAVRERAPEVRVVLMTGFGSVGDAVEAMRAGATDYLIKPVARDELLVVLERAVQAEALQREVVRLRRAIDTRLGFEGMVGSSAAMRAVLEQAAAVADTQARVLILGETGTGKELVAQALHARSRRARRPFVAVNCGAIPENLLESELFGHERGAFTGAVRQHAGRFEQADGGTLFLDELGEIPASMQVRLLRVLQDGEVTRVGGSQPIKVDVRVVAATHRDLADEVRQGRFRADLYYRLNVVTLRLPPLRARTDDIPALVDHFAHMHASRHGRTAPTFAPAVLATLARYDWPGNVRELEHVIERAVLLSGGGCITSLDVTPGAEIPRPETVRDRTPTLADLGTRTLPDALDAWERAIVEEALREADDVQAQAARRLGVSRSNLAYRLQRLGIRG